MKICCMVLALTLLSGCSVLSEPKRPLTKDVEPPVVKVVQHDDELCLFSDPPAQFPHNCNLAYWLDVWIDADSTPWVERKAKLAELTQSDEDRVLAFLLSLPTDTPYQDRLRAQLGIDNIHVQLTDAARQIVDVVALKPNKQMMELESAMSVLSNESTSRGQQLQHLRNELELQQRKLEELLQIEATLMDKSRSH